jgi:outer membrane protein assembly factor BamD
VHFHSSVRRLPLILLIALAATTLAGCETFRRDKEFDMKGSPERIFNDATRDIAGGNYAEGIRKLELLEARFPFSDPAKQAQLDLMYAYYKNRESESAIDQADQFIRENPTHPRVDYAYYIRGLVSFEGGANWFERVFNADMSKRPPQEARQSFQSFQALVQGYPKSPYAADARQRMVYLRNRLADYELEVAKYYMKRGAYVGALNRARGLIETYDGAPAVNGALKIAAQAYQELGMNDLALVAENIRTDNLKQPDVINQAAVSAGMVEQQSLEGGALMAGRPSPRASRWEARVGAIGGSSTDVDFKGGTNASVDSGVGFMLGIAWHYSDRLQFGSTLSYDSRDYDLEVAGDEPDESYTTRGSLDTTSLMFDVAYDILTGPLTPYVSGGVGWNWVDTNIVDGPPTVGCWWDPWYGYICTAYSNTKTINGFAYQAGLGLRWDFSDNFALDGGYKIRWVDFQNATGTPSFDGFELNLGWKF